jgi:4-diphosphocytidyl-2-C-methyl-D-erythritol kinase
VPFFLGGENAFVEGIGERLTPIAWAPRAYCVVKPPQPVSTEAIFSSAELARNTKPATLEGSFSGLKSTKSYGRNDLQPVAERLCPAIAWAARWLDDRYGNSRMSGSGSAVFSDLGILGTPGGANEKSVSSRDRSMERPEERSGAGGVELPEGWIARRCRSLDHHPLKGWAG